jgi:transposase InsO family protein
VASGCIDPSSLSCFAGRHVHLSLQSRRTGQAGLEQPSRRFAGPACPCAAASRRLADQPEKDAADLSRVRPAITQQNAKRRVKAKLPDDRRNATRPNETWAMHFVHDQLATGQKLRVLTIVDTFSRFSPAREPRLSFRGTDVVEVLERVRRTIGLPATTRLDQAPSLYHAIWICGPTGAA